MFNMAAKPGTKACSAYTQGTCTDKTDHFKELHICSHCLSSVKWQCAHQECFCRYKQYALLKN